MHDWLTHKHMIPAEATQSQTLAAGKHAKQACPGSLPAARLCHTAATHREGHLCSWCQGTRVGQHEKTLGGRKLVTVLRTGAQELGGLGRREGGHLAQKGHNVIVFALQVQAAVCTVMQGMS